MVVAAALGSLVLLIVIGVAGGHGSGAVRESRLAVTGGGQPGALVVNPVVRLPRLPVSVFAPLQPCQIEYKCLE